MPDPNDSTEPTPPPESKPEAPLIEEGRKDGAPPGAPAPPAGVDAEGKPIGHHWSKELKRWAKNRGKYKPGGANSTPTDSKPQSGAGSNGSAPTSTATNPGAATSPPPSGSVAPESSAEKEERRKRKRADMAVQAETYEPLAKSGLQVGNEAFFKPGGIDLFKLPSVGFRTTKDGEVVAMDPDKGANVGDNMARSIAEIAGGLAPGMLSWPYSAPLLSIVVNAVSLVVLANAINKATAQKEREARASERAAKDAPHSEDIKVRDASTGEAVAA